MCVRSTALIQMIMDSSEFNLYVCVCVCVCDGSLSLFICRFQRNVLDLTLQWRFAGLPNNAKLEVVVCVRQPAGAESAVCVICVCVTWVCMCSRRVCV